jgi:hypothetical protein
MSLFCNTFVQDLDKFGSINKRLANLIQTTESEERNATIKDEDEDKGKE